jgi:Histidine kinase-, DNA gyrase B-, and HSP90-like ATPase
MKSSEPSCGPWRENPSIRMNPVVVFWSLSTALTLEAVSATEARGMGIGLSICRSIVAAHHGHLWAEPNTGAGAAFHLEIPTNGGA